MSDNQDIELWERELRDAGWEMVRLNVYQRPEDGALFRGPYGAWCALHSGELDDTKENANA